jgi:hypothetical protein
MVQASRPRLSSVPAELRVPAPHRQRALQFRPFSLAVVKRPHLTIRQPWAWTSYVGKETCGKRWPSSFQAIRWGGGVALNIAWQAI